MPLDNGPFPDDLSQVREAAFVLRVASSLVEKGWCRGSFAAWGPVPIHRPESSWARRFCASGAIERAGHILGLGTELAYVVLAEAIPRVSPAALTKAELTMEKMFRIIRWNDRTNKAVVLAGFETALETLDDRERWGATIRTSVGWRQLMHQNWSELGLVTDEASDRIRTLASY